MAIKLLRQISSVVSFHCLTPVVCSNARRLYHCSRQLLRCQADKLSKRPSKATVKPRVHAWVECLARSYG